MQFTQIIYEVNNAVALVTLNRPDRLNAWTKTMMEELIAAARLAAEIAENTSAVSTALSRHMLWDMMGATHPMEAHKIESKCLHYMFRSADVTEGIGAFLEKRPPRFTMRPTADMPDFFPWRTQPPYEEESEEEP